MRILAIDVGAGTQDIMVYDGKYGFDNAYKLVLPSATRLFAAKVRNAKGDLVISGDIMGGGPFTRAVLDHVREHKVYMTETAARTIRDDLAVVKGYGIEIITEDEVERKRENAEPIVVSDINRQLLPFLSSYGIETAFDAIAIAAQDHGVAPTGTSDRANRFNLIEEKIGGGLDIFGYFDSVPENLSRMHSLLHSVKRWYDGHIVLMDTGPAAVLGSLEDERVKEKTSAICINVGNAHTIAMSLIGNRITGVFEHHTRMLEKQKLNYYIQKLADGTITNKEVFDDGGHGALALDVNKPDIISLTGPQRAKMKGLGIFSAPGGDMMMTGPVGLIKLVLNSL